MIIQKLLRFKNKKTISLLFLVSLLITVIWFREGKYIGGGEEGLWLLNAGRSLRLYAHGWTEYGTGAFVAAFLPRIPVLVFMTFLQLFLTPQLTQAILFFILIFSGIAGMFFLTKEIIGENKIGISAISGLFYFFNLFTMTQVWNRHIYSGFFTWSYLPIFLYLWIKWIRSKKILFLILFLVSSVIYSISFVTIAFIFTIWIPLGIYILLELYKNRKDRKSLIFIIIQFLLTSAFWLLINIWWIYPLISSSASAITLVKEFDNISILKGVSVYFKNKDIFLLRQSFYFNPDGINEQFRGTFYYSGFAYILSICALGVMVIGVISSLRKKYFLFLLVLLVSSWFLIKGSNRPFGIEFYTFLFEKLPVTQMFRNPYEKLGVMFVLPYAVFFSLGINLVIKKFKKYKLIVTGMLLILICGVLVWPMWNGHVYANFVKLNIPDDYKQINEIINKDSADVRILNLPPINGEGAKFDWGYQGIVPYEFLFDKPTIARNIYIGNYYQKIYDAFKSEDLNGTPQILDDLNIRYAVIHNDLDVSFNDAPDLKVTRSLVDKSSLFEFIKTIGNLSLYKYNSKNTGSRFVVLGKDTPQIEYEIDNPTKYIVRVTNATAPYELLFKESFNKNWEARINGVKIEEHNQNNEYTNSWRVNSTGNYKVDIVYKIWPWD